MKQEQVADLIEILNHAAVNLKHLASNNPTSDALCSIASALDRLGTNTADTPMGAIEVLAMEVKEGASSIASAIVRLAEAVENKPH